MSASQPSALCARAIAAQLADPTVGIYVYPELDSTNAEAKRLLSQGARAPFLVAADAQTLGRGRLGRSFFSPSGAGMYLSLVCALPCGAADAVRLTTMASVAVLRAIVRLTGKHAKIKWVNDLFLGGKKICGILCEGIMAAESGALTHAVIGVGLNLLTTPLPREIAEIAGALDAPDVPREAFIAGVTNEFLFLLAGRDPAYMDDYRAHSMVIGRAVTIIQNGVQRPAEALSVADDGALLVRYGDGTEDVLRTGELSLRLNGDMRQL